MRFANNLGHMFKCQFSLNLRLHFLSKTDLIQTELDSYFIGEGIKNKMDWWYFEKKCNDQCSKFFLLEKKHYFAFLCMPRKKGLCKICKKLQLHYLQKVILYKWSEWVSKAIEWTWWSERFHCVKNLIPAIGIQNVCLCVCLWA